MQMSTLNWVTWNALFASAIYVGYCVSAFAWLMLGLYLLVLYPGGPDSAELPVDPIQRARRVTVADGRPYDLAAHDASQALHPLKG